MEVITAFVLILLGTVGARNIPVQMDEPSRVLELVLVDDVPSHTKAAIAEIFGSAVDVEKLGLRQQNNAEEELEDVNNVAELNTKINANNLANDRHDAAMNVNKNNKEEQMERVLKPVEIAYEGQETIKAIEGIEDRVAIKGDDCPKGKVRVGTECWLKQ